MPDIDYSDPCAVLEKLRPIYYKLLGGEKEEEFEFASGNGQRRRVRYTAANLGELKKEITRLEAACAKKRGERPRRHAIVPGGQRL